MKNELKIMALVIILYRVLPSCYHGDLFVTPIISLLSSITGYFCMLSSVIMEFTY